MISNSFFLFILLFTICPLFYIPGAKAEEREFDGAPYLSKNSDESKNLTPEEARRKLRTLAKIIDTNKDGYVDSEELSAWVDNAFKAVSKDEAIEQMQETDADGDGYVTWQEQAKFSSDFEEEDESDVEMFKNEKALFLKADLNKDGLLDKEEFNRFVNPEEYEDMREVLYQEAMGKKDKDKDGFLSAAEFLVGLKPGSENYITEKDRFQVDLDKDGDGKLNREEVIAWLVPSQEEIVQSEVEFLLERTDDNRDGRLSPDEIAANEDTFISSEATNFGESLHHIRDEL